LDSSGMTIERRNCSKLFKMEPALRKRHEP
jgi:hypothetical protein